MSVGQRISCASSQTQTDKVRQLTRLSGALHSQFSRLQSRQRRLFHQHRPNRHRTWDGSYYRVVDSADDKVYTYNSSGSYISGEDFDLSRRQRPTPERHHLGRLILPRSSIWLTDYKVYTYEGGTSSTPVTNFGLSENNRDYAAVGIGRGHRLRRLEVHQVHGWHIRQGQQRRGPDPRLLRQARLLSRHGGGDPPARHRPLRRPRTTGRRDRRMVVHRVRHSGPVQPAHL